MNTKLRNISAPYIKKFEKNLGKISMQISRDKKARVLFSKVCKYPLQISLFWMRPFYFHIFSHLSNVKSQFSLCIVSCAKRAKLNHENTNGGKWRKIWFSELKMENGKRVVGKLRISRRSFSLCANAISNGKFHNKKCHPGCDFSHFPSALWHFDVSELYLRREYLLYLFK